MKLPKNPIQPIITDKDGVRRFRENSIVRLMVDLLKQRGITLNELHVYGRASSADDWDQFNQLIGYSVANAPINYDLLEAADLMEADETIGQWRARAIAAERKLEAVRTGSLQAMATLFNKHPDDFLE